MASISTTSTDAVGIKYVFQVAQHECEHALPIDCLNWELARASKGNLRLPREQERKINQACTRTRSTPEQSAEDSADMACVMHFSMQINSLSVQVPALPTALRQGHRGNGAVQKALFASRMLKQDFKSADDKPAKLMHGLVVFRQNSERPSYLEEPTKAVSALSTVVALYKWNSSEGGIWERVADAAERVAAMLQLEPRGHPHSLFLTGKTIEDACVSQFGPNFNGCFVVSGFE